MNYSNIKHKKTSNIQILTNPRGLLLSDSAGGETNTMIVYDMWFVKLDANDSCNINKTFQQLSIQTTTTTVISVY